ncbi:septal ring factor EnvC (AmiA/AmiB activator) [Pararhizobium capsulatum DSM 1112]|uniref:Septal ring factor EnvC (AmiA/AmiB activator) n=1 Tax=Pararhizobium capsulatum DSM 1112 TaxID=1121113 RepID=A0ABU0BIR0_9HYPH|nr:murein hydrolase activator EnvC [Pararhizobium capsulatum]MDQ0318150.1 septal ring factor EnvC (AmiA/AmiB activator) [Pararhizobium capsulatum DSM 1112]
MTVFQGNGTQDKQPKTARASLCCIVFALSATPALILPRVGTPVWAQELPPVSQQTATNPEADLSQRRDKTRGELDALSKSITLSKERTATLEQGIAELEKTGESLRAAVVESAGKRQALEQQIIDGEAKLGNLRSKEDAVHQSLRARRSVLAEVLAALQRMGRNPPPALLVAPEDALASVRSAILLGAVVPGIRKETENLAADLRALSSVRIDIAAQKKSLTDDMTARMEEERRMSLLMVEKSRLRDESEAELLSERRKSEELAAQATSLEGLIGSLEGEIASVRAAADATRAEVERQRLMSEAQREQARELARTAVPDKNRIAPAYAFSDLQKKLVYPAAGKPVRRFGDADGTGHSLQGMMLETDAGAVVTAPSDGWIVFAGSFRSYGQMIILNPGDGYHVVLSGMDAVNVQQGQFVVAGEPLAVMGAKRVASATALALETDRPTLYIEFRKDGKPVDSRPWWTAQDTGKARNDT